MLLGVSCTSKTILRDEDYKFAVSAARSGNFSKALEEFPKKEKHGFITSIEKVWLQYWNPAEIKKSDLHQLQEQIKTFDDRKYLSVTREAEYFFYQESEDGYLPAEHEVIILYLLSAQVFLEQKKISEAQVELRRASYLLQGFFTEKQQHFDDPALRIWLAALWTASGSWQDAQVDLRRAFAMSKDPRLKELIDSPVPPAELELSFTGVGPDLEWIDESREPRFQQSISPPSTGISFSSRPWYARHLRRNSEIRDVLLKSNYMAQFLGVKTRSTTELAIGKTYTAGMKVASALVVVGGIGAAVYLSTFLSGGGGEALGAIVGGAFLGGTYLWGYSEELSRQLERRVREDELSSFEKMRVYRFVRFLPQWVTLDWKKKMGSDKSEPKVKLRHRSL